MSMLSRESIDFLLNPQDNGWDKGIFITDLVSSIEGMKDVAIDEATVATYEGDVMPLDEFVDEFFDKVIGAVCNVIETQDS